MPLIDITIRNAKPLPAMQKLSHGGGLQLWVTPAGGKVLKRAYRFDGAQKTLALGPYPAFSLSDGLPLGGTGGCKTWRDTRARGWGIQARTP